MARIGWTSILLAAIPVLFAIRRTLQQPRRLSKISKNEERVLILGASGGIGRAIAHIYAARGARVCIVGRRKTQVDEVVTECSVAGDPTKAFGVVGDFSNVDDMIRVRDALKSEWNGVDTVIVAAGVSALRPLMAVAGVEAQGKASVPNETSQEGIHNAINVMAAATTGNVVGPLVSAVTFIPLLKQTSSSPSILLVSSLAAAIPAPTRSLYASTKSASLLLYQSLAMENPSISFSYILPSTVEGSFRASAVDGGSVVEADPNVHGLKREAVAERCVKAIDQEEGTVFVPAVMRAAVLLYWIWPSIIQRSARKKYNFSA